MKTNLLFFRKGEPTEKIWYYDLSDLKVGKTNPFTLDRFGDFFDLLPERADSQRSWTIDVTERKAKAAEQSDPLKSRAKSIEQDAAQWRERLSFLKKAKPRSESAVKEAEAQIGALTREARDLRAKAEAIDNAVYDLKAVNPNAKNTDDTRTPAELIEIIEAKGRELSDALAQLRASLSS